MTPRIGYVADAALEVLADRLARDLPALRADDLRDIAHHQVQDLKAAGWQITAPVNALARRTTTT